MNREEELEAKAEEIADEAVKGYEKILPPEVIAEIRRLLVFDMLATERGRATLRGCLDDPVVEKSDDLSTSASATDTADAAQALGAKKRGGGVP